MQYRVQSRLVSYPPGQDVLRAHLANPLRNAMYRAYRRVLGPLESLVMVSCGVVADPSHYFGPKYPKTSSTTATNTTFTITTSTTIIMQGVVAS